jgi:tetratricopeptide (TPR) repeat protein
MTECRVIVHYLWLSLWPHPLIFDYGSDIIIRHAVAAAPYALILVLLVAGVVIGLKRRPAVGFVGAWFFATLAPASSVVPVAGQPMAEHRMYLPLAAVVTLVVIGIYTLIGWRSVVVYLALAVGLGFLTVRRNEDYRSKLAIWSDTVAKCPSNPRAHNSLGVDLAGQGKVSEAIAEYAVALRLNPDDAEAHNNLGWALASQGKVSEAIAEYTAALQIKPDYADIHNNLGVALADQGKVSEAIAEYAAALRLNPDHAEAHNNFGVALVRQGRVPEAVEQFEQALRIKPDSAEAHNNLANALLQQGNVSEAIAQYREALRLAPDWPPALYKLAWILATDGNANSRNAGEAVQLAERLCVVTGDRQAEDLDVLAAAYAEVGRFSDAIRVAQKAIELASVAGQQELAQQVQERLKLYQAGRPP